MEWMDFYRIRVVVYTQCRHNAFEYVQKQYKSDFCIIGLKLTGVLPISSCTVHSLYCMKLCYLLSPESNNHTLHYLFLHSPLCFCTSFPTTLFSYIYMRTSTLDSDYIYIYIWIFSTSAEYFLSFLVRGTLFELWSLTMLPPMCVSFYVLPLEMRMQPLLAR